MTYSRDSTGVAGLAEASVIRSSNLNRIYQEWLKSTGIEDPNAYIERHPLIGNFIGRTGKYDGDNRLRSGWIPSRPSDDGAYYQLPEWLAVEMNIPQSSDRPLSQSDIEKIIQDQGKRFESQDVLGEVVARLRKAAGLEMQPAT